MLAFRIWGGRKAATRRKKEEEKKEERKKRIGEKAVLFGGNSLAGEAFLLA